MDLYPARNPEVIVREEDDKALIFNQENEVLLVMNQSALFVWNLCDGKHSIDDIERAIKQRWDFRKSGVKVLELRKHLERYLRILKEISLISYNDIKGEKRRKKTKELGNESN